MKRIAVYAGTFDPPTLGHIWMIQEASKLFDEVVIAIGVNPDKKTMFTLEERLEMLNQIVTTFSNVRTTSFVNEYLIHYAVMIDAGFIIRGIRNNGDYEYERAMRHINGDLGEQITTVFLMPPREISEVSSSVVKGLVGPMGWERVVDRYVPKEVMRKLIISKHTLWRHLQELGASGNGIEMWEELLSAYMDDSRHYHNWKHVTDMATEFKDVEHFLRNPLAVEMAIWYHDAVYDAKSRDNEEKSAELAKKAVAKMGLSDSFGSQVATLIMATKHATLPPDRDAQFLVDLDLAILGKSEKEFDEYELNVRKEYEWVPWEEFASKRAQILQSFLDRHSIYSTQFFRDRYESVARKNIARSIAKLRT
jgi:pantetheine-phosphate adenylyltransferase